MLEYNLDLDNHTQLVERFKKLGEQAERLTNDYFERTASKKMMESIIGFIPVSKKNKKHARNSNPLKRELENLGFTIKSKGGAASNKGSFGYLIFPDEGRGFRNPLAQNFSGLGAEAVEPSIVEDLIRIFDEQLNL